MYALTKFLEFFLAPGNALALATSVGALLLWSRWRKAGLYLTTVSAALLIILLVLPIGDWLLKPLENEYARPDWPRHVDGIVVLGGGLDPEVVLSRGAPSEDDVEGRLVAAAELARRYPNAKILFSGGSGAVFDRRAMPEAGVAGIAFAALGVDTKRILYEAKSRNTWENLVFAKRIARSELGEVWVLTTSASQLPRAMEVARRLDWKLLAWPSDYKTARRGEWMSGLDLADNLQAIEMGLHEWLGIVAYRLSGRAVARSPSDLQSLGPLSTGKRLRDAEPE